ncbi:unnamed protein product [Microthlaspi erraticum]|uniref:Non-specific lipid-transfer protein n=1 Tax=Microthlaspi erraticum TaxID=1685480 RepID=A0A6D2KGP5_9BRAS|nr:unnamed protein product [Microthlaspi erraticum]
MSCDSVMGELNPCISFVLQGGTISTSCCNGVTMLNNQAQTSAQRRSVCRCIKYDINGVPFSPKQLDNALNIPSKCGVDLPYRISPATNCDSVN